MYTCAQLSNAEKLWLGLLLILKLRYLHVLRGVFIFINFSLYLFFSISFLMLPQSFLGSLSFYHLIAPKPGGCSFYSMYLLWFFISTFWEKKKGSNLWASEQIDRHCCSCQPFSNSMAGQLKWLCLTISHFSNSLFFSSLLLAKPGGWLQLYDLLPLCSCKIALHMFTLLLLFSPFVLFSLQIFVFYLFLFLFFFFFLILCPLFSLNFLCITNARSE